ncbi:MAG: hypothetical protein KDM91_09125 [Verrucomicrobiae bacterium]|nr:hypothetical protein [Verrucomicrobiae bacterium]MCP5539503.1 hypothetical protein [Akkermansiaceae bacterium]MCP5550100.1 hypothetical protein [Akkermansiaceae bacterium]
MNRRTLKLLTLFCLGLAALPAAPRAQETGAEPGAEEAKLPNHIQMRPTDKRALSLNTEERNPYARRSPELELTNNKGADSEENRIRAFFQGLSIGGVSRGVNGLRVLVGDIILEKGRTVRPVLEDQTEELVVTQITDQEVELGWVDLETGELTGKRLSLGFDLTPGVAQMLPGQGNLLAEGSKKHAPKPKFHVLRPDADRRLAIQRQLMSERGGGNGQENAEREDGSADASVPAGDDGGAPTSAAGAAPSMALPREVFIKGQ